jgi:CheY-like chemotaxis protein
MADLRGARVLLVEDEAILAMSIEDMLRELGCDVIGPALSPAEAHELVLSEAIDAAVLDINMGEGVSFEMADMLQKRSVPFCFSTGYGAAGVAPRHAHVPVLPKPYSQQSLAAILNQLLEAQC